MSINKYPIIKPEHMPREHRKYLDYNADMFIRKAEEIGSSTLTTVKYFLQKESAPEQGYKSCAALMRLAERYGAKKLESACGQILSITAAPSVRTIGSVLKNSQSEQQPEQPASSEKYGITRGSAYYGKGGGKRQILGVFLIYFIHSIIYSSRLLRLN